MKDEAICSVQEADGIILKLDEEWKFSDRARTWVRLTLMEYLYRAGYSHFVLLLPYLPSLIFPLS